MDIIIREYENKDFESLNNLLNEVFNIKKSKNIANSNIELVAINNEYVVGYLTINKLFDSVQNLNYANINYVCVLEKYRNMGICSKMLDEVVKYCKKNNISYIELTSNPTRKAARHLYEKKGFAIRETSVYRKEII